jgi:hypothetical protein
MWERLRPSGGPKESLGKAILAFDKQERGYNVFWLTVIIVVFACRGLVPPVVDKILMIPFGYWLFSNANQALNRAKQKKALEVRADGYVDNAEIGSLILASSVKSQDTVSIARKPLLQILPRLRGNDREYLSPIHYEWIRRILRTSFVGTNFDIELVAALLEAQRFIATADLVVVVEDIASGASHVPTKELALSVLPAMRESASRLQNSTSLLRAADPAAEVDVLVRPACGVSEVDEAQLLRPL